MLRHPAYHAARVEGALAQLGERHNGIVEVSGSIPLGSTNTATAAPDSSWDAWAQEFLTTKTVGHMIVVLATALGKQLSRWSFQSFFLNRKEGWTRTWLIKFVGVSLLGRYR